MRTFFVVILILTAILLACTSEPRPLPQAGNDAAMQTAATTAPATEPPTEMPTTAAATSPQPTPTATATTAAPTPPTATTPPTPTPTAELPTLTPTPTSQPARPTATTTIPTSVLRVTLSTIPSNLPTYDRHDWKHWTDADGDCQDARNEVLVAESRGTVSFRTNRGCKVSSGQWLAPYTSAVVTDPSKLDVDHMVPLTNAHAHASGAWNWSAEQREQYANHLADLIT